PGYWNLPSEITLDAPGSGSANRCLARAEHQGREEQGDAAQADDLEGWHASYSDSAANRWVAVRRLPRRSAIRSRAGGLTPAPAADTFHTALRRLRRNC